MLLWWVGPDKKLNAINGGDKRWRDKKQSMEEEEGTDAPLNTWPTTVNGCGE